MVKSVNFYMKKTIKIYENPWNSQNFHGFLPTCWIQVLEIKTLAKTLACSTSAVRPVKDKVSSKGASHRDKAEGQVVLYLGNLGDVTYVVFIDLLWYSERQFPNDIVLYFVLCFAYSSIDDVLLGMMIECSDWDSLGEQVMDFQHGSRFLCSSNIIYNIFITFL